MSLETHARLANILLVDDSAADIELVSAILKFENVQLNLFSVRDGDEAINFLRQEEEYKLVPQPDLLFLDLNMRRVGGREVLDFLRRHKPFDQIPVVTLSGSEADADKRASKNLGALYYLVKPLNYKKLKEVVALIDELHFENEINGVSLVTPVH